MDVYRLFWAPSGLEGALISAQQRRWARRGTKLVAGIIDR